MSAGETRAVDQKPLWGLASLAVCDLVSGLRGRDEDDLDELQFRVINIVETRQSFRDQPPDPRSSFHVNESKWHMQLFNRHKYFQLHTTPKPSPT
jgi:hypothetical protein